MAPPPDGSSRWLFGPWSDLLLGCGMLYATLAAAFTLLPSGGPNLDPVLLPLCILVINMPHYAGTLLRVYETREERHRYALFTVYCTIAIVGWFYVGLHDAWFGSLLVTVYITWSPWHYSGQNYGLALMFLRRAGVDVSPLQKRAFQAAFVSSYFLFFLVVHREESRMPGIYGSEQADAAVQMLSLGIPTSVGDVLFYVAGGVFVVTAVAPLVWLSRRTAWRNLAPAGALVLTQTLWFALPYGLSYGDTSGIRLAGPMWIAVAHGAQYLWVTTYYARASQGWSGYAPYLGKTLLVGVALWTLPLLIFSPDVLGPGGGQGGLWLLMASAINVHHFVLDGAIWKLRHSRIRQVLIRGSGVAGDLPPPVRPHASWTRRVVWSVVALGFAAGIFSYVEGDVRYRAAFARRDLGAAVRALDRASWLGGDSAAKRQQIGRVLERAGRVDAALAQYRRSIEVSPMAATWLAIAKIERSRGRHAEALHAFEEALAIEIAAPRSYLVVADLARQMGQLQRAARLYGQGLEAAREAGDAALVAELERRLSPETPAREK